MTMIPTRKFKCLDCGHEFEEPFGKPRWLIKCPNCGSQNIVRVDIERGRGAGRGAGWRGGWCRGRGWGRDWRRGGGRGWGWRWRFWEENNTG
jgi:DNA-directed RNA polymerase subunit RPC12/RpoP